jgi:hypothetical protein
MPGTLPRGRRSLHASGIMAVTVGSRPTRGWLVGLAWSLWVLVMLSLAVIWRLDYLLRQASRLDLARWAPA